MTRGYILIYILVKHYTTCNAWLASYTVKSFNMNFHELKFLSRGKRGKTCLNFPFKSSFKRKAM